jgi:putative redox protein
MPTEALPPLCLELTWEGELRFAGRCGEVQLSLDAAQRTGPTPVQALAFSLAGCMAIDVANILSRGRQPLRGLRAQFRGERSATSPKRFTAITLHFVVEGEVSSHRVERALELSRNTYCSVWQSMRQDIEFITTFEIRPAAGPAPAL